MRVSAPRLSLLGKFSLLSLVLIAGLGVSVAAVLHARIERRALVDAQRVAEIFAAAGVQSHLRPSDLERPLSYARLSELDMELQTRFLANAGLARLKVFDRHGRVAYSDDPSQVGEIEREGGVREALAGRAVSDVDHGTDESGEGEPMLEAYVPMRWSPSEPPAGVMEVYLPYGPVARSIAEDTRTLYLLLAGGFLALYASLFRIVSRASRRLRHQALHDALTGLPNRTALYQRTATAIAGPGLAALLLVDLDRFQDVNDTLGHDHGDRLLVEVAERLAGVLRRGDMLARLGGDEFAVLLTGLPHRGAAAEAAARLQGALSRPFALGGVPVELDASVGVALYPEHGKDVTTLVRSADVAMYLAKRGRSRVETYDSARDPHSPGRLALLGELRRAIDEDELELHYQPKVEVATGELCGVEALVRWRHPQRGLLGPGEFVDLAERTGTIHDLTRWVLDAALAQVADWREQGLDLAVAINLAAADVVDPTLPAAVAAGLARHGLPGERLECEISEHTVMADPERAMGVLAELRELGVGLSLDDFGTGQSSLAYLKRLPLDEVKIDRGFVLGMDEDEEDQAIVRATVDLARALGLRVVAEGVECPRVLARLAELRCDVAQGFLLGRPQPAAELGLALRPA
jgi:diguanylate cyclase (GGDEF)-like protein